MRETLKSKIEDLIIKMSKKKSIRFGTFFI